MKVQARKQGPDWRLFVEIKTGNGKKKKKKEIYVGTLQSQIAAALVEQGALNLEINPSSECLRQTKFHLDYLKEGSPLPGSGLEEEHHDKLVELDNE